MENSESTKNREDMFSKAVRAGKRTYFFDVKATRQNEFFLTITESKKIFNQQTGKFSFEKHKIFLYREDFDKFKDALHEALNAIMSGQAELADRTGLEEEENNPNQ